MKRKLCGLVLALGILLGLTGCGPAAPQRAADGGAWEESWVTVGNILGVEEMEALEFLESSDALEAQGMYYAAWTAGEAEAVTNEDGEEAQVYDAQLSLVLAGYKSAGEAEEAAAEWLGLAEERYNVEKTVEEEHNGQAFTVLVCTYVSETNPYARGAAAFGVYGNYALSAELSCREGYDGDALAVLQGFLDGCHYAA